MSVCKVCYGIAKEYIVLLSERALDRDVKGIGWG